MAEATAKKVISVIPAKTGLNRSRANKTNRVRVAAYCRVSTLFEQQESSFEAQKSYYTNLINTNEKWTMAGIYADDGISGTDMKKREEFNRMISDCEKGKIDMVITKSISRFARNTVDTLNTIRKLKAKNIAVYFEKEHINTLEGSGELLITILSSQAQEESRNLSENTKWGIIRRYETGKVQVNHSRFMGYRKNENGELVIVPEEAEVVRLIYRSYMEGMSCRKIKQMLESKGIPTVTGKKIWHDTVINNMLSNEKYMGDALLQKTYTVDYLTKKRVKNNGIAKQYYITDDHEAIIPKELFYAVQKEKMLRAKKKAVSRNSKTAEKKYSSKYILTNLIVCGECGQPYRRIIWTRNGEKEIVWRCGNRVKNGTKYCKHSATVYEERLKESIMNALNRMSTESREFQQDLSSNVHIVRGNCKVNTNEKRDETDEKIFSLEKELSELTKINIGNLNDEEFLKQYHKIGNEIQKLKREKILNYGDRAETGLQEEMCRQIEKTDFTKGEFDEVLVKQVVESIRIMTESRMEIRFKSGFIMSERITGE